VHSRPVGHLLSGHDQKHQPESDIIIIDHSQSSFQISSLHFHYQLVNWHLAFGLIIIQNLDYKSIDISPKLRFKKEASIEMHLEKSWHAFELAPFPCG